MAVLKDPVRTRLAPVSVPVQADPGARAVAVMVPYPVASKLPPVPKWKAPCVFVPGVTPDHATLAVEPPVVPQVNPAAPVKLRCCAESGHSGIGALAPWPIQTAVEDVRERITWFVVVGGRIEIPTHRLASIVPPEYVRLPPLPITRAAVLVPPVSPEKLVVPPDPQVGHEITPVDEL